MPLLRLAYICRRRMMRTLAMNGLGTVAVVEEVDLGGESGGIEVDSPPPYGMVCRKAMVAQIACSCHFYDWRTYVLHMMRTLAMVGLGTVAVVEEVDL